MNRVGNPAAPSARTRRRSSAKAASRAALGQRALVGALVDADRSRRLEQDVGPGDVEGDEEQPLPDAAQERLLQLGRDQPDGDRGDAGRVGGVQRVGMPHRGVDRIKATLYRDLGLRLTYDHDEQEVEAEISTAEASAKRGVRGGT